MRQLSNNCRVGNIGVHPKNWDAKRVSGTVLNSIWYIKYRFYDDNLKKSKQVVIKGGINEFHTIFEKQSAIRNLIESETKQLMEGYNPITQKYVQQQQSDNSIVSPRTKFVEAIQKAQSTLNLEGFTKSDMKFVVEKVCNAARKVLVDSQTIDEINIYDIKKRHIRALMNRLAEDNNWSAHSWNKYRSYLMMLFKELGEYDAVESNIPREISKRKIIKKVRVILSESDRIKVREYLQKNNPRFWLFLNMFFHSDARVAEFFRMKVGDVNLKNQTMKVTIKKGRQYAETIKPIKNIAIPYWEAYLCGFNDESLYLMGKGLYPAVKQIRYFQINHRWQRIKNKLNIDADFYSLKHLNSDEVAAEIGIKRAQRLNSHSSINTYFWQENSLVSLLEIEEQKPAVFCGIK